MGFFRRGGRLGLKPKDLALLDLMTERGADLDVPRHVVHYLYFGSRAGADAAAAEAAGTGWSTAVRDPLPDYPGQWCVVCERDDAVLAPAHVRDTTDRFEALAARHGGEYDGWEAAL